MIRSDGFYDRTVLVRQNSVNLKPPVRLRLLLPMCPRRYDSRDAPAVTYYKSAA